MQATTVKIHPQTKMALDKLKEDSESYDDVIEKLVTAKNKKTLREELIREYQSITKDEVKEFNEWEETAVDSGEY